MARTESSLPRRSVTMAISVHMAKLMALRIFGRLNTTVAMGPSCSTRMWSLMSVSLLRPAGWWRAGGRGGSRGHSLSEGQTDFNLSPGLFGDHLPLRYDHI